MQDAAPVSGCSHPRTSPSPGHRPVEPLCPNSSCCELFRAPAKTPKSQPVSAGPETVQVRRAFRAPSARRPHSVPGQEVTKAASPCVGGVSGPQRSVSQHLKRGVLRLGFRLLTRACVSNTRLILGLFTLFCVLLRVLRACPRTGFFRLHTLGMKNHLAAPHPSRGLGRRAIPQSQRSARSSNELKPLPTVPTPKACFIACAFPLPPTPAVLPRSVSAFQRFSISAFQHVSISAFPAAPPQSGSNLSGPSSHGNGRPVRPRPRSERGSILPRGSRKTGPAPPHFSVGICPGKLR